MIQVTKYSAKAPDGLDDAAPSLARWFAVCLFKQAIESDHITFKNKKPSEAQDVLRDAFAYCYGVDAEAPAWMRLAWPELIDSPVDAARACWNTYVKSSPEEAAVAQATWEYLQEVWGICGDRAPQLLADGTCFLDPPHKFCGPEP